MLEKQIHFILDNVGLDQFTKYMSNDSTLDQLIARISNYKLNIVYTVLDDLKNDIHPDILKPNPLVEKMLEDRDNDPGTKGHITDSHNQKDFKLHKKCFNSINF